MSNRLPVLQATISEAHAAVLHHRAAASEKALEAGAALVDAKAAIPHGAWSAWLAETGVPERTAQRYMALHRLGLKSATVSDLGGITATLEWARAVRLPKAGNALAVSLDGFQKGADAPLGCVWPGGDGYFVGVLDLNEASPHATAMKKPILREDAVWGVLWQLLDYRFADMTFQEMPSHEGWAGVVISELEDVSREGRYGQALDMVGADHHAEA